MVTTVSELESAAVSDRGLNAARPQNEDSFLELPHHGLFAVADGVGGAQAGEVASQMAVEILGEAFINMGENADPEDTMRVALERANEAIHQMSRDIPQLSSMATTIVAVHISGDMATIGHVGDSRAYRVDANGRIFRETDDHSLVEEEVRAGRMTPQQALNHPSRNVISRALGADETVAPDIKCVLVRPGTTFLLCSDGITRHIDDTEIAQLLNSEFGPEDICSRMKDICFSRGAEDNLTAVVMRFSGDRQLASVAPEDDEDIEEVTLTGIRVPSAEEAAGTVETAVNDQQAAIADDALSYHGVDLKEESGSVEQPDARDNEFQPAAEIHESAPGTDGPTHSIPAGAIPAAPEHSSYSYDSEPTAVKSSGIGRIFPAIALLILGLGLGSAGSYFWLASTRSNVAEVPPTPVQQSENIPQTSFESTRRLVDEDPVKYLNARAASPQEADDFFWLGRALLLTGKPVEAKRQFEEARTRLSAFDDLAGARTMANEIAMALAIIDDRDALTEFSRSLAAGSGAPGSSGNSAVGGNAAIPFR